MIYREQANGYKILIIEPHELVQEFQYMDGLGERGNRWKDARIEHGRLHMEDCPCYDCWAGLVEDGDYSVEPLIDRNPTYIEMFVAQGRDSWMLEEWGYGKSKA